MAKKVWLALITILSVSTASATIINVPADSSTIQGGINGASDGDTVLVQAGTHIENIKFNGKNIVVGSLFIITGDPSYISGTVIDGNQSGSVVTFENGESSNAVLSGFTITNGSSPTGRGGGIHCWDSSPSLKNLIIRDNFAALGGGIVLGNGSAPILSGLTIFNNSAGNGGGIYCSYSNPTFDSENRCNIYFNSAVDFDNDLYAHRRSSIINVVVDTFTVMNPTDYYAHPRDKFTFDILNAKVELVDSDLYVNPDGDNANSGLLSSAPLKTIRYAQSIISASSENPHTIYLSDGIYSASTNGESLPVRMLSYVSLSGESESGVVIELQGYGPVAIDGTRGITIENLTVSGSSLPFGDGGISCRNSSSLIIQNVTISGNYAYKGGGIRCWESSLSLVNVTVSGNTAKREGGGIYFIFSDATLVNVKVTGNQAEEGGGIYLLRSYASLERVTVAGNTADYTGGGIYLDSNSSLIFDNGNRCNIYLNQAAAGNDLYNEGPSIGIVNVLVDTFTVLYPTGYHASPIDSFTFDILNAKVEQVDSDLYVSPDGDDANSGLSTSEPVRTISFALSKILANSLHPNVLHLSNGTYSPSTNGEVFPVEMIGYVSLSGESQQGVILDAKGQNSVISCDRAQDIIIENLTVTGSVSDGSGITCWSSNANLRNMTVKGNSGCGVICSSSSPSLADVTVRGNDGTGIAFYNSNPNLVNVIVSGNIGGIYCVGLHDVSSVTMANVTVTDNSGSGIYCESSSATLVNTILWDDGISLAHGWEIGGSTISIAYSDVQYGLDSIDNVYGTVNWLDGNIDADPLFCDPDSNDYSLAENSPCIGTGEDGANMGALGVGCGTIVATDEMQEVLPTVFALHPSYPNPFNPVTTIQFDLPEATDVILVVYDIRGREVMRMVDGYMESGYHQVQWGGQDQSGRSVPSGIYIARLVTPEYSKSIKMVLLK